MEFIGPVLILMTIFTAIVWIVRTVAINRRLLQIARLQSEMQTRLLEKFGTGQELVSYLESPAGQKFLESATIERRNPFGRILGSIQAGIVLGMTGLGFFFLHGRWDRAEEGFLFLGTMGLALGVGFLLSSAAAYFLSRSWGLLDGRGDARVEL
ncbi:MAG TPA: hypothetical protein VJG13_01805 [Thermoanaerobaculia bacterium]|jgi:hypothetical protein|nr:hypothetical protein [Thermoanaerobaculia bacterium]